MPAVSSCASRPNSRRAKTRQRRQVRAPSLALGKGLSKISFTLVSEEVGAGGRVMVAEARSSRVTPGEGDRFCLLQKRGTWQVVCVAASKEQGPRQRKGAAPAEKKSGAETHQEGLEFSVENLQAVQTDFSPDPLQKVVRFNHDATLLATGGTDGYVRVWKVCGLGRSQGVSSGRARIVRN